MRKVCAVVTARPSYSRIKTALLACKEREDIELQVIVAASALLDKHGNVAQIMERDGLRLDRRVHMSIEGDTPEVMAKVLGLGCIELSTAFADLDPDIVLTVADRYETLATAISASYMNIPLAHVQGGEQTGSIDDRVRNAITQLATFHFVSGGRPANRVFEMTRSKHIYITGCPSIDLAAGIGTVNGTDLFEKYGGVGGTVSSPYMVVMQHPVTTEWEEAFAQTETTLDAVSETGYDAVWFWPGPDAGNDAVAGAIRRFRERCDPGNIRFFKNMEPEDFLVVLKNAKCIVGNSSAGIREASYLGVPAVNIGSRQQGRQRAENVVDVPHVAREIRAAIEARWGVEYETNPLYGWGNAGQQIAAFLATLDTGGVGV